MRSAAFRAFAPAVLALLVAASLLAAAGCAAPGDSVPPDGDNGTGTGAPDATGAEAPAEAPDADGTPSAADAARHLLVLGRSVMTGWVDHWGGSASEPAEWEGRTVTFREIEGPPGIAASAIAAIAEAPAGSIVLFKYCFVDFNGGDFAAELDAYTRDLEAVADAAAARGVTLVLGTALPRVRAETTPELVAEHRAFAERVEALATDRIADGESVLVLDLNAVLAAADGSLESRYAVSRDDSHLTGAAYDALDEALLAVLPPID